MRRDDGGEVGFGTSIGVGERDGEAAAAARGRTARSGNEVDILVLGLLCMLVLGVSFYCIVWLGLRLSSYVSMAAW